MALSWGRGLKGSRMDAGTLKNNTYQDFGLVAPSHHVCLVVDNGAGRL